MKRVACKVYALFSTENGEIRYIGQTTKTLAQRLKRHVEAALEGGTWPLCKWIRKTLDQGHAVEAVVLIPQAVWNETEIKLIVGYRANGARLLNATDGGRGVLGMKQSEKQKQGMRDRIVSPETRRLIASAVKRRFSNISERTEAAKKSRDFYADQQKRIEHGSKVKEALSKPTAKANLKLRWRFGSSHSKAKRKMSAAHKRLWATPEHRAKMRKAHQNITA